MLDFLLLVRQPIIFAFKLTKGEYRKKLYRISNHQFHNARIITHNPSMASPTLVTEDNVTYPLCWVCGAGSAGAGACGAVTSS